MMTNKDKTDLVLDKQVEVRQASNDLYEATCWLTCGPRRVTSQGLRFSTLSPSDKIYGYGGTPVRAIEAMLSAAEDAFNLMQNDARFRRSALVQAPSYTLATEQHGVLEINHWDALKEE